MPDDSGPLPHQILLAIARGETVDGHAPTLAERLAAAKAAAPFYAPKLATVAHEGTGGGPITVELVEMVIVDPKASGDGSMTRPDPADRRGTPP